MITPIALIFDFGGVISRTLFETHALSETALGLPAGSLTWRGPFDPDHDALWRAMVADEISEREYWHRRTLEVAALLGADWTVMADFVRAARGAAPEQVIRPEFLATLVVARSAGVRLAILSNELDLFYGAEFREKLSFLSAFECIHDATYTGIMKPDPRAYLHCLAALQLPASQCLFVDDQWRNIRGAESVGLQAVHFDVTAPARSYRKVRARLQLNTECSSRAPGV